MRCMWSLRGGDACHPLGLGVRYSAGLCQGSRTLLNPTHEKEATCTTARTLRARSTTVQTRASPALTAHARMWPPWLSTQGRMCQAQCATRSAAVHRVAQRARDTCTTNTSAQTCVCTHCDTWHSRHRSRHIAPHVVHQSCLLSLTSAFHLPPTLFRGSGHKIPSCTAVVQCSGCAAFCQPLSRDSDAPQPHARKRGHMHHSTHTESAQHHTANTRVACTHSTRAHVASLALNPRR